MKKRTYNIKFILFLGILGLFSACDSELEKTNPNNILINTYYSSIGDVTSAVNGIYAGLQDPQVISREWFFVNDLRGDDMEAGGAQLEVPRNQILIGSNDASNAVANDFWNGLWGIIHRANAVIEYAPNAVVSEGDKATLDKRIGEAKFLRAWAYYELVVHYGSVPLYEQTAKLVTDTKPLSPIADVYASIVSSLNGAIAVLPKTWGGGDLGRVTSGAARGLLAKVYMQQGDYTNAQVQLDAVINSADNPYKLVDNYNDNFLEETEYNAEAVFEVGFMDQNGNYGWGYNQGQGKNQETTIHNQEICPVSWGNLVPSNKLMEEFEAGDPRFKYSFYQVGDTFNNGNSVLKEKGSFNVKIHHVSGEDTIIYGWRKHTTMYKKSIKESGYYPGGINERVMRYAEILLMMAECVNETGGSKEDVLKYLNPIRARKSVNMPLYGTPAMDPIYPVETKEDRFKAIVHEKRVELNGEEIRAKDIKRWRAQGKLALIGGEPINYYTPDKEYLPIPQSEVDNNPNF